MKTVVLPSVGCFSCPLMSLFYGMSLMRSGVGLSRRALVLSSHQLASDSAQNMMKPTAPQVVRNMSGASISFLFFFSSAAPW